MQIFIMNSFMILLLLTNAIYSLPVLNFTSSVLTNSMIDALSHALLVADRQKPSIPLRKNRQQVPDRRPAYKQDLVDQQHQPYPYYQPQHPEQHQPLVFQGAQIPDQIQQQQYPSVFYQTQYPEYQFQSGYPIHYPEHLSPPSYPAPAPAPAPIPEPQPSFHQVQSPAQQLPPYQTQQTESQHVFYPQNAFETQQNHQPQHNFYPQNVLETSPPPQYPIMHPQPVFEPQPQPQPQPLPQPQPQPQPLPQPQPQPQPLPQPQPQPQPLPQPQQQTLPPIVHAQPAVEVPPPQIHPPIIPPHQPEQHTADHGGAEPGFLYPFPYENVNWYNFPQVWQNIPGGTIDLKSPAVGVALPEKAAGTGECPIGFCPTGATCTQYADQWQCGCGQNTCAGIQNPCGIFGRYYFPYYPDPSRFIQCDQTGVFWIRRCGPGTIFDPKISVCNYPPVVVETGKK